MKILVLDNPALVDELRREHEVVTCGRWEDRFQIICNELHPSLETVVARCRKDFFEPEVLLFIERGVKHLWRDMDRVPQLKAYYAVDSHLNFAWQRNYAPLFDVLFVAQKDYVEPFRQWGAVSASWLPLACSAGTDKDLGLPRDIDACFVGKLDPRIHPHRVAFLDRLKVRLNGSIRFVVDSGAYAETYNRSKIILNESVNRDLNQRTFEAMACGGMLLAEELENGQADLFEPGRDLVIYRHGDADQVAELIRYYLEHETDRAAIAEAGRRKVMERHTSDHRAREAAEVLQRALLDHVPRVWSAREYSLLGKTCLMLVYPDSPVFAERMDLAAGLLTKAAQAGGKAGVSPYLALLSILKRQPAAAIQHLTEAMGQPGDRPIAAWILALLLSGQDPGRAEAYYQAVVTDLMSGPPVSPEQLECFQMASFILGDKLRAPV
ncbi:MAG: glycosyltransferase [Nitrospirae bacterium]|nr:glycosyltransferase [Nitrospirota bacterium]